MGNSSRKPEDAAHAAANGTKDPVITSGLTLAELEILQASFVYVKQNCHKVALKGIIRMVDNVPEATRALQIGSKNTGESFSLMNQGLIFMTGIEKFIERAGDNEKLRAYVKQLNASHSKRSQLKPQNLLAGMKAFEGVILECIQTGYQHKVPRRMSTLGTEHPSQRARRVSIVGDQQPLQLLGKEHISICPICSAWMHFFNILYLIFDPKYREEDYSF